jgi:hypothetical protein
MQAAGDAWMRNMSFMLTTAQVLAGTKTVTRRLGWKFLKPGDLLMACVKCQGLGKGGRIQQIRPIEVVSVRREPLDALLGPLKHCTKEARLEGFPDLDNRGFMIMFCRHMKCEPNAVVTRIEFKYVTGKTR